jgi:hypothetical protein
MHSWQAYYSLKCTKLFSEEWLPHVKNSGLNTPISKHDYMFSALLTCGLYCTKLIICNHLQISLGRWRQGEQGGRGTWHAWERRENCTYKVLVWKPEGKSPLGRPRSRWEERNTMDLREIRWEDAEWIQMAQNKGQWRDVVNAVMNLRVLAPGS